MIDALIQGRLVADPARKQTKAGKDYATAWVSVSDREGGEHLALVTAFDEQAVTALLAVLHTGQHTTVRRRSARATR